MSDTYIDMLKQQSQHEDAEVRLAAVQALLHDHLICGEDHEDMDWEMLECWALDSDERIRDAAIFFLGVHKYDEDGVKWSVWVLSEALGRYASGQAGIQLSYLAHCDDRWFDLTWDAVGDLLDTVDSEDMVSVLTCGYVEDVVRERGLGPDNPHIKKWIEGGSQLKKLVLLAVADWLGPEHNNLREIVERLLLDPDPEVSERAKEVRSRKP